MPSLVIIFCIICLTIDSSVSSKILAVFPVPLMISNQVMLRPLIQELVKRGHEVVVITADPVFPKGESPQNLTEIDVHDLSYKMWKSFLETEKGQTCMTPNQIHIFLDTILDVFEVQVKSEEIQKLLNDKARSFDLLFVEACVRPALSFAYRYKVPVIEISSLDGVFRKFDSTGTPADFFLYSLPLCLKFPDLSSWKKILDAYNNNGIQKVYNEHVEKENKIVRSIFGPRLPGLSELSKTVQLIFLNASPTWDSDRSVQTNIIYLGGIHQNMSDIQLPKEIKTYLDSSKNGVIYMSFGTYDRPSLLPAGKLNIFTNVFSQLPYDILWKWDIDEIPARLKNVKVFNWLPQSDLLILEHPKVKLFITQGGIQSTDEALTAGVPLISFLNDRLFSAGPYDIGIYLDMETITEAKLKNAIKTTIQNNTYRDNVVKLQLPIERALWWIEYVLRHGGVMHLQSNATHTDLTECYSVADLLSFFPAVIAAVTVTVYVVRLIVFHMTDQRHEYVYGRVL